MKSHRFQLKKDLNCFKNLEWEESYDTSGTHIYILWLYLPYKKEQEYIIRIGQYCNNSLWYVTQEDSVSPLNFILDWSKGFKTPEKCKEYVLNSIIKFLKCFE